MLRRTFLAASAIALIALGYSLGSSPARAQAPGFRVVGDRMAVSGGVLYRMDLSGWHPISGPPVPPDDIAWAEFGNNEVVAAITQSGEGWNNLDVVGWQSVGVVPGAPTPSTRATWGELKGRYR
jgi:hypothetical protein